MLYYVYMHIGQFQNKTCTMIAELPDFWCGYFSSHVNNGKTTYEACCACGGGTHVDVEPSSQPSISTSPSSSHSPSTTQQPSIQPTECVDEPGFMWDSTLGYGCDDLTSSNFCNTFASVVYDGKTTLTACCLCGGGINVSA